MYAHAFEAMDRKNMKKDKLKELEERIKKLEEKNKQVLPTFPSFPREEIPLDPLCLHNGCHHERNPFCNLYCPHCAPRY